MKIIGIILVKNEDIFIMHSIKNIIRFCDKIIILDNYSTDKTHEIIKNIKNKFPNKIDYSRIKKISQSHKYIESYANKKNWIFRVDGDEIFDEKRLLILKKDIKKNKYNNFWRLGGVSLNCTELDNKFAKGFLSPPSKTTGVLFNFNAIKSWTNCRVERLHYGDIIFKNGFNHNKIKFLGTNWENSKLRNLHFFFFKRSSREKENIVARNAPFEIGKNRYLKSQIRYFAYLMISLIKGNMKLKSLFYLLKKNERLESLRKIEQYCKGNLVRKKLFYKKLCIL
jgi:glycosyltransferase involved in cell wall biosynthesis